MAELERYGSSHEKPRIVWAEFQNGWLGILPCGITIAITRIKTGAYLGGFQVRFGTDELLEVCWTLDAAKVEGKKLASKVLWYCAAACENEDDST